MISNAWFAAPRRSRPLLALSVACLVALAASPVSAKKKKSKRASSGVDAELRQELEPMLMELKKSEQAEAKQAALLSWGLIADEDAQAELETLKTAEQPEVRLGAGLALMIAGQKGSSEFVITELGSQGELYVKLRDRVSVLKDGVEWELLEALLKKEDEAVTRDVMRYLATQDGELLERLVSIATNKKESAQRAAALEALQVASAERADLLGVASTLNASKDLAVRQAAVAMYGALSSLPSARADALKALVETAARARRTRRCA